MASPSPSGSRSSRSTSGAIELRIDAGRSLRAEALSLTSDDGRNAVLELRGFDPRDFLPDWEEPHVEGTLVHAGERFAASLEAGTNLRVEGDVRVAGTAGPAWTARVDGVDLAWDGRTIRTLALDAHATDDGVAVERIELVLGRTRVAGEGLDVPYAVDSLDRALHEARGALSVESRDVAAFLAAVQRSPAPRDVPDHVLEIEGALADGVFDLARGFLEVEGGGIRFERGRIALADLEASGDVPSPGDSWRRADVQLDADVSLADLEPLGRALGRPGWTGAVEGRLRVAGKGMDLNGQLRARLDRVRAEGVRVDEARLDAELAGPLTALRTSVTAHATGVEVAGVRASSMDLRGTPEGGAVRIVSSAKIEVREGAAPMDVSFDARIREAAVEVAKLELSTPAHGGFVLSGSAPLGLFGPELFPPGPVALEAESRELDLAVWLPMLPGGDWSGSGELQARARLAGPWRELKGDVSLNGDGLELASRTWRGQRLAPVSLRVELELDRGVRARGRLDAAGLGHADLVGSLSLPLDVPLLISGIDARSFWGNLPIDARVDVEAVDLGHFQPRVEGVRRLDGSLAANVKLIGEVSRPRLSGKARLDGIELRMATAFPALRELGGDVVLTDDRRVAIALTGRVGGSPFRLDGEVDGSEPDPALDLHLTGDDLLLARTSDLQLRADLDVRLSGTTRLPVAGGSLTLTDGFYARNIDLFAGIGGSAPAEATPGGESGLDLSFARDGFLASLAFDLEVDNTAPLEIETNLVSAELRPDLAMRGTGAAPLLSGRVYVDDTIVSLPSGRLRVDSGLVIFDEASPYFPRLQLPGRMRARGFDISADISGPYDDPTILLTSTPPLPQEDLLVLFLTGQLPDTSRRDSRMGAAKSVAVYLTQDYLTRWLTGPRGRADEESILERIDIEIGGDVTRSGSLTTNVTYHLTGVRRGVGRSTYLAGEKDVYDKINFGWGLRFRFQ